MKPITTSVYTFRNLIEGGYLYVDKTALLHTLVAPPQGVTSSLAHDASASP